MLEVRALVVRDPVPAVPTDTLLNSPPFNVQSGDALATPLQEITAV